MALKGKTGNRLPNTKSSQYKVDSMQNHQLDRDYKYEQKTSNGLSGEYYTICMTYVKWLMKNTAKTELLKPKMLHNCYVFWYN